LDAAASYQQMIVLAPGSTEAWNNLGWALGQLGFRDASAACFREALVIDPSWQRARANLNWVLTEFDP
jgi:Tfp pilus assembly protein PilF